MATPKHIQWEYRPHERHVVGGLWHFQVTGDKRELDRPFPNAYEWAHFQWAESVASEASERPTWLWLVSRQLYMESMPFRMRQADLLSFGDYWVLSEWMKDRTPRELRLVKRLCMPMGYPYGNKLVEKAFTGLREVYVYQWPSESDRRCCAASCESTHWRTAEHIKSTIEYWKQHKVQVYLVHDCPARGKSCHDAVFDESEARRWWPA